ncbi:serine/threonine protein kinase [bacterium]|nr:serine/threonine protein kinase [bacterium]
MSGVDRSEAVHAATAIIDPSVTTSVLSFTVPPPEAVAETLSRFDPRSARRSSLMSSLERDGSASSPLLPERYELGPLLGQGGMGVVHLAKDRDLARPVALKQLKGTPPSADVVERFLREAQVTAQLEHPGIVPVHDVGADEAGHFYYIMRLVRGDQTLRRVTDLLRAGDEETHRNFTLERRVKVIQQIALILHYAHTRGVVHRDVKPENIMLGPYGEVYLLDWGLAKIAGSPAEEPVELGTPLGAVSETRAGRLVGTPLYMAPEQARGAEVSPRTDVYSLTAVLYELLSLHHYLGEPASLQALLDGINERVPAPAEDYYSARNGRVPRALSKACERGLAKDPAARFASTLELENALQRWSEGETPVLCPATLQLWILDRWRRAIVRHPVVVAMTTFVLPTLGVLALLGYLGWTAFSR